MKSFLFAAVATVVLAANQLAFGGGGGCSGGSCEVKEETTASTPSGSGNATQTPSQPSSDKEKAPKQGEVKPVS